MTRTTHTPTPAARVLHHRSATEWDEAETGRGLLLIEALATTWGARPPADLPFCTAPGTVMWAEFPLPEETTGRPGRE